MDDKRRVWLSPCPGVAMKAIVVHERYLMFGFWLRHYVYRDIDDNIKRGWWIETKNPGCVYPRY